MPEHILITGAAGFIATHLIERLLGEGFAITGLDNFVRGTRKHIADALRHPAFQFYEVDVADPEALQSSIGKAAQRGPFTCVWHLAANSDIAAGGLDPVIDLRDTFHTTFHLLQAMREFRIPKIAFASTSAIYGAISGPLAEDTGPLFPISNYGAMKLASEAAISAALESYLEQAWIFRFPNVVGPRATHGVIYDLVHKLARHPEELEVLGDGTQQKPYLHVSELIDAMAYIVQHGRQRLNCYNIGARDEGTTVAFIAASVCRHAAPGTRINYTGGNRGWVGDVPKFQYSTTKLDALGWRAKLSSNAAIDRAVEEICIDLGVLCKP